MKNQRGFVTWDEIRLPIAITFCIWFLGAYLFGYLLGAVMAKVLG
jgi:hypothetical protein